MSLEQDLHRALRRKDPPNGFDDRVLSRIASGDAGRMDMPDRRWPRAMLPLAASLMLALGATYYVQQQDEQRRAREAEAQAQEATQEVVFALLVASEKVVEAQIKVQESTHHEH